MKECYMFSGLNPITVGWYERHYDDSRGWALDYWAGPGDGWYVANSPAMGGTKSEHQNLPWRKK